MAYGLEVFAGAPLTELGCVSSGGTWNATTGCSGFTNQQIYSSEDDQGFMYIGRVNFGDTGNGVGTYTVAAEDVDTLFAFYTPFTLTDSGWPVQGLGGNYGKPDITVGTKVGNNFPVTVTSQHPGVTTLTQSLSGTLPGGTNITVADGSDFPDDPQYLLLSNANGDSDRLRVASRSGNTFTTFTGATPTLAFSYVSGDEVAEGQNIMIGGSIEFFGR